jgi:hypothetical protein
MIAQWEPPPGFQVAQIGPVTVVARQADMALAIVLGEEAAVSRTWLGQGRLVLDGVRIMVVPDRAGLQQVSGGRIPDWGVGFAMPGARLAVILADAPDPYAALRHELGHLVLHQAVTTRVPLWFDEGYAAVAAGELGRLAALQLNLAVVRGQLPDFRTLDAVLRRSSGEAEAGYALAASAVLHLARLHPGGTLDALIVALAGARDFAAAVQLTTGYDLEVVEGAWHRDLRRRYNVFVWLAAGGGWAVVAAVVAGTVVWRRRRDRPRRAALDEGWVVSPESEEGIPAAVDPGGRPE